MEQTKGTPFLSGGKPHRVRKGRVIGALHAPFSIAIPGRVSPTPSPPNVSLPLARLVRCSSTVRGTAQEQSTNSPPYKRFSDSCQPSPNCPQHPHFMLPPCCQEVLSRPGNRWKCLGVCCTMLHKKMASKTGEAIDLEGLLVISIIGTWLRFLS
jgi:hypothetical protein